VKTALWLSLSVFAFCAGFYLGVWARETDGTLGLLPPGAALQIIAVLGAAAAAWAAGAQLLPGASFTAGIALLVGWP
jgi:hypothetical protein